MKRYSEVKFPYHPALDDMLNLNEADIDNYVKWFYDEKKSRLSNLFGACFELDEVYFDRQKLQGLEYFLRNNFNTEPKTDLEIERERQALPNSLKQVHKIPKYRILEPTYSIAFDVGIYFGEYLKSKFKEAEWKIEKRQKMAKFGFMHLSLNGKMSCSPHWLMIIYIGQLRDDEAKEGRLVELLGKWSDSMNGIKPSFPWLDKYLK